MKPKGWVVDSSVWIELLNSGPKSSVCENHLKKVKSSKEIYVPTVVLSEVYRKIKKSVDEDAALEAIAHLSKRRVVELDRSVALSASDLSIELDLGMADAIVLAHSISLGFDLLTLDNNFRGIENTKVL